MFESGSEVTQRMKRVVSDSEKCINQLFLTPCIYSRNMLLPRLESNMQELDLLCNMLSEEIPSKREVRQRDFSLEELSKIGGKRLLHPLDMPMLPRIC